MSDGRLLKLRLIFFFDFAQLQSEFQDPGLVGKEEPYPFKRNTDIIRASGDRKFDHISTYQNDYQCWEDVHAPKSYNVIETYKQPTVPMICETNQRAHFKGNEHAGILCHEQRIKTMQVAT